MSGFSTWAGRIRKDPAWPTEDSPIGAVTGRDYAINNAMHYADIHAQNRVCLTQHSGAYITGLNTTALGWRQSWQSPSFPVSLRPDGSSYRLRVRVAGAGESALFDNYFAVSIGPTTPGIAGVDPAAGTTDNIWLSAKVNSTTAAYLTGASMGTEAWPTMIALTAPQAAACSRSTATIVDVAGAPISVVQAMCVATLWTYTEDPAHPARIYAFSLEEWPGGA